MSDTASSQNSSSAARLLEQLESSKRSYSACTICRKRKTKCKGGYPGVTSCRYCVQTGQRCVFTRHHRKVLIEQAELYELEIRAGARRGDFYISRQQNVTSSSLTPPDTISEASAEQYWDYGMEKLKPNNSSTYNFAQSVLQSLLHTQQPSPLIIDDISNQLFPSSCQNNVTASFPRRSSSSSSALKRRRPQLPPYEFAQELYAKQHLYIGTVFSFIRPDDFEARLAWVYSSSSDGSESTESRLILCQILTILAFGTMYSVNQWVGDEGPPGLSYFKQALDFLPSLHEEASVLFVEVLGLVSYYMQNLNWQDSAFLYIGAAVRMAMRLGLHQEAPALDNVEREHRRRVWWSTYSMDKTISIKSGNPSSMQEDSIEANMPSQCAETEWSDYTATTLSWYTDLSKILGQIMNGVYGTTHSSSARLMDTMREIDSSLEIWFTGLPKDLITVYNNIFNTPVSRESMSVFLHYHQCINLVARPLLFHLIRKQLRPSTSSSSSCLNGRTQEWRTGMTIYAVKLIEKCIYSARATVAMMTQALEQNNVATYGFMDGEHAFAAVLILVLVKIALQEELAATVESGLELLAGISRKGNAQIRQRLEMLIEIRAAAEGNGQRTFPPVNNSEGDMAMALLNEACTMQDIVSGPGNANPTISSTSQSGGSNSDGQLLQSQVSDFYLDNGLLYAGLLDETILESVL